jgi:hypothetical protein
LLPVSEAEVFTAEHAESAEEPFSFVPLGVLGDLGGSCFGLLKDGYPLSFLRIDLPTTLCENPAISGRFRRMARLPVFRSLVTYFPNPSQLASQGSA